MEKGIWAVRQVPAGSGTLDTLLYEEWEPFAVTEISKDYQVWLRKIVKVEVKDVRDKG